MIEELLHPVYTNWLTAQTRWWRVDWAGNRDGLLDWLEPAVDFPNHCERWRHNATWDIVREAVRQHQALTRHLQNWEWPSCQSWWLRHGGPQWDPYGLAFATMGRNSDQWASIFANILHHPIQPGLAIWAYGAWRSNPRIEDIDLSEMSPTLAVDCVLRSLSPEAMGADSTWKMAWQDWVAAEPPDPSEPEPIGRYPTGLVTAWQETLAARDRDNIGPPVKSTQIQWF